MRTRRAFSLIELLVVIAIIAVLMALLVPAVQKAREFVNQLRCRNNLKQLALGCKTFESAMQGLPALYSTGTNDSWMVQILPYIDQQPLFAGYVPYSGVNPAGWQNPLNADIVKTPMPLLLCPTGNMPTRFTIAGNAAFGEVARTDYFAFAGAATNGYVHAFGSPAPPDISGIFGPQLPEGSTPTTGRRFTQVSDGLSSTVMLGEIAGRPWPFIANSKQLLSTSDPDYPSYLPATPSTDTNGKIVWGTPHGAWAHNNNYNVGTWSIDGKVQNTGACSVNCSNFRGLYSFHRNGAFVAFGDGTVRMIGVNISEQCFMAIITARANDVPDGNGIY